jgi:hypothetical protein
MVVSPSNMNKIPNPWRDFVPLLIGIFEHTLNLLKKEFKLFDDKPEDNEPDSSPNPG